MTQIILHTSDEISICDSGNIYDMVQKFRKDLEKEVFKFNPYDICVANIQVNEKTHSDISCGWSNEYPHGKESEL